MGKLSFLKKKKFYINLLVIVALTLILLWLTIRMLNTYTRHDKVVDMPDFSGMTTQEVERMYGRDYHFILIDSIYSKTQAPGSIVQQDPLPGSKVKHGRNVYYIIVATTPERTNMPNLNNLSLRQALVLLESSGLEVEHLQYVDHFARNAIREQRYNGEVIRPGTELVKGSRITLYVGLGTDRRSTRMPALYGMPAQEVRRTLNMSGLNLGTENYDDYDSIQYMKVYRTSPPQSRGELRPGTSVDVWYRSSRHFNFETGRAIAMHEDSVRLAAELFLDTIINPIDSTTIENEEPYEDDF